MPEHEIVKDKQVERFADLRSLPWGVQPLEALETEINYDLLQTLSFDSATIFPKERVISSTMPEQLMELAKDPGLGIRKLHQEGITGKGISVAIVDSSIFLKNPECEGKIISYWSPTVEQNGSMHGLAVTSLLIGTNVGTAPEAKVHYAVQRDGSQDEGEAVKALLHLIEVNKSLDDAEKIRIISVSAAPTVKRIFVNNTATMSWLDAVRLAESEDILVLDCTPERSHVGVGYYDLAAPNEVSKFTCGFQRNIELGINVPNFDRLHVPASRRTTAEQYSNDVFGYIYWGHAGDSWTTPYVAGVLALGLQVKPQSSVFELYELLFETAYVKNGLKIINPPAFIERVKSIS